MTRTIRWRWTALFGMAATLALVQLGIAEKPGPGPNRFVTTSPVYSTSDRVRFDHTKHAGVACATCHAPAATSKRATDQLTPSMAACATCHAGAKVAEPALETCNECHVGHDIVSTKPVNEESDWESVRPAPMPVPRASSGLRFDHALHVGLATSASDPEGCTSCHGGASKGVKMPSMASCQTCHDGSASGPSAECATCHATDGGVLETDVASGPLKPGNHDVAWMKRHGTVAASNPDACATCHLTEEDCAGCHVESVAKPFAVHPPNYLVIHSVDARSDQGSCTDCHRVETFCTSCHTDAQVVARPEGRPPERLQYHPGGWVDSTMPNNHGVMARRNLNECASCHVEDDCVSCHAGVNPHPANFALECRQMESANRGMCRRCHEVVPPCL